mmetsp:Transcript_63844/g.76738  ORF Transcript_63844/g.76738 Transcript_63844/m.76738 type:complete len:279 (+) Transcript_63844:2154-2990(+)
MFLASVTEMELTKVLYQRRGGAGGGIVGRVNIGIPRLVEPFQIPVERLEAGPLDARGGAREAAVDNLIGQPHCFKHLRAFVTLQRGDAHLGHDLEYPLAGGLAVIVDDLVVREGLLGAGLHQPLRVHFEQRLVGHMRADPVTAVPEEEGKVGHLLGIARFGEHRRFGTLLGIHEPLVDRSHRQETRNRHLARPGQRIAQNNTLHPGLHFCWLLSTTKRGALALNRLRCLVADPINRSQQSIGTRISRETRIDHGTREARVGIAALVLRVFQRGHFFQG